METIEIADTYGYDSKTKTWQSKREAITNPEDESIDVIEWLHRMTPDEKVGHNRAMVDVSTLEKFTFREFKETFQTVAAGLSELGVKHGDVMIILLPNSVWYPIVCFAMMSIGGIAMPMNPVSTLPEIEKQVKDSGAVYAITTLPVYPKLESIGLRTIIIGAEGDALIPKNTIPLSTLLSADHHKAPRIRRRPSDIAVLHYSSGTTGLSKGVMISHGNIISVAKQLHLDSPPETRERRYMCVLPMFHVLGLIILCFGQLTREAELIIMPKFEVSLFLASLEKYRVTDLYVVPPMVLLLAQSDMVKKYDLNAVVELTCAAAPLGRDLMEVLHQRFPSWRFRQGYGLTETSGFVSMVHSQADRSDYGSVGELVSSMAAKVVDVSTGENQGPYAQGEICLKGPNVMQGYLNNQEATAATIDTEGWLHTGDLGHFDEVGRLYVVDRLKELIKYKGFQVAPAELEALLLTHPQILDAAVVPKPDERAGELPIAYVVLAPESNLTDQEVITWVAQQVSPYKRLREVTFIDVIPKSASGKILRRELVKLGQSKASFASQLAASQIVIYPKELSK